MEEIGVEGQKKLAAASVLIIGAGGLGSPAAMYLAAAGVGRIGIAVARESRKAVGMLSSHRAPLSNRNVIRVLPPERSVK